MAISTVSRLTNQFDDCWATFWCSPLPVSCSERGNENEKLKLKAERTTSARVFFWVWFSALRLALPALFSLLHTSPARGVWPSDPSSLLSCLPPSLCPRALVADCVMWRLNEASADPIMANLCRPPRQLWCTTLLSTPHRRDPSPLHRRDTVYFVFVFCFFLFCFFSISLGLKHGVGFRKQIEAVGRGV